MSKWFFIVMCCATILLSSTSVFAALGSCVQGNVYLSPSTGSPDNDFRVLEFNCTFGTGADATASLTSTVTTANMGMLKGMYLFMGTTYNGATAPTALYDIYLRETVAATADAVDILGGAGTDRPGTAGTSSQFTPNTSTTYLTSKPRPVLNTLKLTTSGNSVVSGNFIVQFIFAK